MTSRNLESAPYWEGWDSCPSNGTVSYTVILSQSTKVLLKREHCATYRSSFLFFFDSCYVVDRV